MQNPGRSRREALVHPSQGRHRPRPLARRIVGVGQTMDVSNLDDESETFMVRGCPMWKSLTFPKSSYIIVSSNSQYHSSTWAAARGPLRLRVCSTSGRLFRRSRNVV